jgi:hypothetical protein
VGDKSNLNNCFRFAGKRLLKLLAADLHSSRWHFLRPARLLHAVPTRVFVLGLSAAIVPSPDLSELGSSLRHILAVAQSAKTLKIP